MADRYQSSAKKSTKKFEVMGRKEVAVRLPLPLVEVWEELQPEVEHLTGLAGLKIIRAVIEDEVMRRVGPRHQPDAASSCLRWGSAIGLRGVCRAESGGRATAGTHAPRGGSSAGQLCAAATRRATAASGTGRNRRGVDVAELPAGGAERAGWLRDREVQREPGVCAGQRGATENAVREKTK
jgi:hypothetical protein